MPNISPNSIDSLFAFLAFIILVVAVYGFVNIVKAISSVNKKETKQFLDEIYVQRLDKLELENENLRLQRDQDYTLIKAENAELRNKLYQLEEIVLQQKNELSEYKRILVDNGLSRLIKETNDQVKEIKKRVIKKKTYDSHKGVTE